MTGIAFNAGQGQGVGILAPTYGNNQMWFPKWQIPTGDLPNFPMGFTPSEYTEMVINVKSFALAGGNYGSGNTPDRTLPAFPFTNIQHKLASVFIFNQALCDTSFTGTDGPSQLQITSLAYWDPADGLFHPQIIYEYVSGSGDIAGLNGSGAPVGTFDMFGKSCDIKIISGAPNSNSASVTVNTRF